VALLILLLHVIRGNRNKWLLLLVSLLLLANISLLLLGYSTRALFIKGKDSLFLLGMLGSSLGLEFVNMTVSHYLLAAKYYTMVRNVPAKLDGKPEVPMTSCEKATFWTLLIMAIIFPASWGVAEFLFRRANIYFDRKQTKFVTMLFNFSAYMTGFIQIITGIVLVSSVFRIKRIFRERNAENYINSGMLLRHASAFGLYLVAAVVYFSFWTAVSMAPFDEKLYNIFLCVSASFFVAQFISEILLCTIFWSLGTAVPEPVIKEEESPEVVNFDEDAELQAGMWN
jgi:hypothetical protein